MLCYRSNDGLMLLVTSSDCYCSIITFALDELGDPLASSVMFGTKDTAKPHEIQPVTNCSGSSLASTSPPLTHPTGSQVNDFTDSPASANGNSATGQVTSQVSSPTGKPRRIRPTLISSVCSETVMSLDKGTDQKVAVSEVKTTANTTESPSQPITTTAKVPRRVNLITLSSYKKNCPPQS